MKTFIILLAILAAITPSHLIADPSKTKQTDPKDPFIGKWSTKKPMRWYGAFHFREDGTASYHPTKDEKEQKPRPGVWKFVAEKKDGPEMFRYRTYQVTLRSIDGKASSITHCRFGLIKRNGENILTRDCGDIHIPYVKQTPKTQPVIQNSTPTPKK